MFLCVIRHIDFSSMTNTMNNLINILRHDLNVLIIIIIIRIGIYIYLYYYRLTVWTF